MLRFFPSPYPDESIYSLFTRYSKHIRKNNVFSSIKQLLGKMHLRVSPLFACNLAYMCNLLPEESEYTPEYFIDNHTVLPFYKPFVPTNRYANAIYNLKHGSLRSVYSGLGIAAGSILQSNGIKYCPQCINEDREKFKEAYIHRIHQIQGLLICTKHKALLRVANIEVDSREGFFDIEEYQNVGGDDVILPKLYDEIITLASDVEILINNTDCFGDLEIINKKYNTYMHEKGYISPSGLINQVKLQRDFLEYYTQDFLYHLQSQVKIDDESNWLRIITRKKVKAVHPIRHLIFIRFLFGDIYNFIKNSETVYIPFGEPPYPCMNRESGHYKQLLVEKCNVKTNHHTSKAIGTFLCPQCHYSYTINEDAYKRNGFEKVRAKCSKIAENSDKGQYKGQIKYQTELEERYKRELNDMLSKEPNLSRREIIKLNSKAYRWIYKHKREWLESIVQSPKKHKDFYKNTRINWDERDKETLEKVKVAIESIYKEATPLRITIKQIAKVCNYKALSRDINKMTLTTAFITSKMESLEQFHKRKINVVIKTMTTEKRRLVKYTILREAGISGKFYHDYDNFIEKMIEVL